MFKKKFALVAFFLLVVLGISAATLMTTSFQIQPTPQQPPRGPVTQEQAIAIARRIAQNWHEPNAQVATKSKKSRSELFNQLEGQGEDVLIAGTGEVWTIKLSGKFTPNRVRLGVQVECSEMFVLVDIGSGEVIGVGCR